MSNIPNIPNILSEYTQTIFNTCSACETVVSSQVFGISDIETSPKTPCIVDTDVNNKDTWHIMISNPNNKATTVNGIDSCINILRESGEQDNICDACIRYDQTIIFIEIKNKNRNWLEQAAHQISNTIKHFNEYNALNSYTIRKAYIANKHKPVSHLNHRAVLDKMFYEHKFLLKISTKLDIT